MKSTIVVHKIGGSVLKNSLQCNKVLGSALKSSQNKILVVSAIYGVTDILNTLLTNQNSEQYIIGILEKIHFRWIQPLSSVNRLQAKDAIRSKLIDLSEQVIQYRKSPTSNLKAEILSFGERLSAIIICTFLTGKTKWAIVEPKKLNLLTTNEPLNAQIITGAIKRDPFFQRDEETIIVPGFYGHNALGETCLVGRGGSDYSAAAIAKAVQASKLVFWKDTHGVRSADPKEVKKTRGVSQISYQQAELLSAAGATLLHSRVFEEVKNTKITTVFCHPDSGLKELTKLVHHQLAYSGPLMVSSSISKTRQSEDKHYLTLITKNIAGTLARLKSLSSDIPSIRFDLVGRTFVRISVHNNHKKKLMNTLHEELFSSKSEPKIENPQIN